MDKRIVISPRELATTMTVWLRVMPTRIWRELEEYHLAVKSKRQGDKPDPERAVAEYLAGQFVRTEWEVSHSERLNIFADRQEPAEG